MTSIARDAWEPLELLHAVGYFAPEADTALQATGLRGFWMGYFAARSAPLGEAGPELVTACFHGFPYDAVARSLPDAWTYASPTAAWDARRDGSLVALQRLLGDVDVADVSALARRAAEATTHDGRALSAATAAVPWPEEPLAVLWHAATVLREHRGDGHVALLTAAGIDGCEANVLAAARGATTLDTQRRARAWADEAWEDSQRSLSARSLIRHGRLTDAGEALAAHLEQRTDDLAEPPYAALTADEQRRVVEGTRVLAKKIIDAEELPFPNAIALPRPIWA